MNKIDYRPDIDGLRAIAVIAVVIYHAKFEFLNSFFLEGGFLGVDVFFVISGFLITSILFKQIDNKFIKSVLFFYIRRIRRIFPALIFLLLIITPFSGFFLHNYLLQTYSESGIFSLFFFSNIYFWNTGEQYNAFSSLYNPLLHTWSLSVEEQFYLIFPFILFFSHKIFKENTIYFIIVITFFSLLGSYIYGTKYASFNFYSLPSRFWEISVGAIIALNKFKKNYLPKIYNKNLSNLGFILIILSFFIYSDSLIHPSLNTSLPVLGTLCVIYFYDKNSLVYKILSNKILVYIGLISFSLYLWHFVMFSLARSLYPGELNNIYKILLIFISIIISSFSYHFIEIPFRKPAKINNKNVFICLIISYIFLLGCFSFYLKQGSFLKEKNFLKIENNNELLRKKWINYINEKQFNKFSDLNKTNILIIGNSHARDMFHAFDFNKQLFHEYEFTVFDTLLECFKKNINLDYKNKCKYLYDNFDGNRLVNDFKFNLDNADYVLISAEFSFLDVLRLEDEIIPYLKSKNKKIVLLSNTPKFFFAIKKPFTLLDLKLRSLKSEKLNDQDIKQIEKIHYMSITDNIIKLNDWLEGIAERNDINFLRKEDFICDHNLKLCKVLTDEGYKIYWDNSHYTIEGARYLGKIIYKKKWLDLE